MQPALYFHPEAYTTSGPKLMGRNAAGESFLRGFLAYSTTDRFWAQVQRTEHAQFFADAVRQAGRSEPVSGVDKNSLGVLSQAGLVYHPGPGIGEHAWQRAPFGHAAWSLCGITHTTSSAGAMDALVSLLTAPVQPWDAVICTSAAVKDNVQKLLQAQADYLVHRLGIQRLVLPQLPVIPLGIHTSDFEFDTESRHAARAALGADHSTHVVLFMGRLSFHAKAHPLAMYQALEKAAASLPAGERLLLVECGWHANQYIRDAYAEAAQIACPQVKVVTLDGRKPEERQIAWAGADIFCSLSDNIQETFGIVPIEAMAAGLPVVVSDWDGYRDTVRDGVDGFRIPTLMPQAGLGGDLALRHALERDTYDMYCGHTCSLVSVDIETAAQAFIKLIASPELRAEMGAAGRQRARQVYDWSVIIPRYEALWSQLTELRETQGGGLTVLPHPWPARLDPFHGFAGYPTQTLTPQTLLSLVDSDAVTALQRIEAYRKLAMVDFAKLILPDSQDLSAVMESAAHTPAPALELVRSIPEERRAAVFRSLAWLVKLGILRATL